MKHLVLSLCLFVVCFSVQSQEHFTFNGIPIDGSAAELVRKLEAKGYKSEHIGDDGAFLNGTFTGKHVQLSLLITEKTKKVWVVNVKFEPEERWTSLKNRYFEYKDLLSEKYGKPSKSLEFFSNPYYEGDGYELQALKKSKCNYVSFFELDRGEVWLSIGKEGVLNIAYFDNVNKKLNEEEQKEIMMNDI